MRKVVAAINTTLDAFCDHTVILPDEEIHQHYTDLLKSGGNLLYGRITYQLMEYWRPVIENPSDKKSMNDFARVIDQIPKIVFSHTLKNIAWESANMHLSLDGLVARLSPKATHSLMQQNLIDGTGYSLTLLFLEKVPHYLKIKKIKYP